MSSTEQAPEPTMDEILASIRKIISDDEQEDSLQPDAAAPEPVEPAVASPAAEMAEWPSDAAGDAGVGDDILDLTQVLEPQDTAPQTAAPETTPPQGDALQAAMDEMPLSTAEPGPSAESAMESAEPDISALLAEAGVQDTMSEASQPADAAPEPAAPSAEEASITEALSAMEQQAPEPVPQPSVDASMDEEDTVLMPQGEAPAPGEEESDALAMPPPTPDAAEPEPAEPAEMPALDTAEPSVFSEEPAAFGGITAEAPAPFEETSTYEETASEMAVEEESGAEGSSADELAASAPAESRTLEDSVKDMLRPMLRKWLNDNMERIVHDAVKEEVAEGGFPGKD